MDKKVEQNKKMGFLKKAGKWGPIIGVAWIALNVLVPLALLRIPAVQKILVTFVDKLPFDIPGVA